MFLFIFASLNLFLLSFFEVHSKNLELNCKINMELENNLESSGKVYENQSLNIYLNKKQYWLNDIKFEDWKKNYDLDKTQTSFHESEKKYYFEIKNFNDIEKKSIESMSNITLEKLSGHLKFIKFYYDHNQQIFFSSEVRGECK